MTTTTLRDTDRLDRGRERLDRLADAATLLRSRRGPGGPSDRWLLVVGGTLMPLGVVLILLGWYGAAQTVLPFEQTPYLISGGILGLALVFGGGFLYFAYWLTLLVRESRSERERVAEHQARLERLLVELAGRVGQASSVPAAERVVTTPSGTLLHRPDCVATIGPRRRRRDLARARLLALRPVPAGGPAPRSSRPGRRAPDPPPRAAPR